jgi:hypothetical protein
MRKILFTACLLFVCNLQAANDRAFAWEISSENATIYLVGSIHFADKSFYPLRQDIEDAFSRSNSLVVELDVTGMDNDIYNTLVLRDGIYQDGRTVRDELSAETWSQLQEQLQALGVDYETIKHFKPGIIVMQLTAIQAVRLGYDPTHGIDIHFLRQAADESKDIIELETLEQQLELFINIDDGELLLKESLYSLNESEHMLKDLVRSWKQGDEARMSKLLFEEAVENYPAFNEIYERLIFDRNDQMFAKISNMLEQKQTNKTTWFVVVGAGHLIGEKGIVSSLKEKGYDVKRF